MILDNKNTDINLNKLEGYSTETKKSDKTFSQKADGIKTDSNYLKRKFKEIIEIRRKKLKDLYENETINLKYEIIYGKNIKNQFEFIIGDPKIIKTYNDPTFKDDQSNNKLFLPKSN